MNDKENTQKRFQNFINSYNDLITKEEYITKSNFLSLLTEYEDVVSNIEKFLLNVNVSLKSRIRLIINPENPEITRHNEKFIDYKLKEYKDYFDNLFIQHGENIILDEEQRRAILTEEDSYLIIAGAGTGKTTTIAAKVKYLVDKKKIDPQSIIVLSYTNKSVQELEDKIHYLFGINANITTFHALGMKFIRKISKEIHHDNVPPQVLGENKKEEFLLDYIKETIFPNKQYLLKILSLFPDKFSKGFQENSIKYDTFSEYFEDYKKRKLEKERHHLEEYIENRVEGFLNYENPKSIRGEVCKSKAEAKIANYLFKNGIEYEYEKVYLERVGEDRAYSPDFTLTIHGHPIYIEYFGLSSYYENSSISKEAYIRYQQNRLKKEEFHKLNKTDFIALDYQNGPNKENYLVTLEKELVKRNIPFQKRTQIEIFFEILNRNQSSEFFRFLNLMNDIITKVKDAMKTTTFFDEIKTYVEETIQDEEEKHKKLAEILVIRNIFEYYQTRLKKEHYVDYSDMINYAAKYIDLLQDKNSEYQAKYMIIDEYQDISISRYIFTKQINKKYQTKILAVGDDWQAIYAFAGSNVKLFYDFSKLFPNSKELSIRQTYRNSQELIQVSGDFILKNEHQIYKELISSKRLEYPIEIVYYDHLHEFDNVVELIQKIYASNPNKEILLLARRNKTIRLLCRDERFTQLDNDNIRLNQNPNILLKILTVHSAKGLSSDNVIVLNLGDDSFPSHGYAEHFMIDYLDSRNIDNSYPDAEERRLFYVALTRTKNKVYLSTPIYHESRFITEIKENPQVILNYQFLNQKIDKQIIEEIEII